MSNQNTATYWEKKYTRLQNVTLLSTFVGTLLGCIVGNYCSVEPYVVNTNKTIFKNKSKYFIENKRDMNEQVPDTSGVYKSYKKIYKIK